VAKTIVHVNQHLIKFNSKHGNVKPVFTVKQGSKNTYARRVIIHGPSEVVYTPDKPLSCGAKAYIVTDADVTCIDPMTFEDVSKLENCVV